MHLPEGALLQGGKYRIERFISSGGFGCTYVAVHTVFNRKFAIKEFFVSDFCERDATGTTVTVVTQNRQPLVDRLLDKFIDEARALHDLDHPGIVRIHDIFNENGTAYFVMNFIDGRSLQSIIDQEGPMPEGRALRYIRQVCDALAYVHDKNRLHLDIKPGNIMIDSNDNAVLIDFGVSKQYDEVKGENTSTLMGSTPGYAPIEQMGNNVSSFAPTADIYALGGTLYKLLTGVTPPAANILASGESLPPLTAQQASPATAAAIYAAMQLRKDARPQSIREFVSILDTGKAPDQPAATVVSDGGASKTQVNFTSQPAPDNGFIVAPAAPVAPKSSKIKLICIIAAAVVVLVGALLLFSGPRDKARQYPDYFLSRMYNQQLVNDANNGDAMAQFLLSQIYFSGDDGVETDTVVAMEWLNKSLAQDNPLAMMRIGEIYSTGGMGLPLDNVKKQEYYDKALPRIESLAKDGDALAQNYLGVNYEYGTGVPKDDAKAVEWYTKAAEQGYAKAQCNLGLCYFNGNGVPKDEAKAVEWYTKAAEQGYAPAQYYLGFCYAQGMGVAKDIDKAEEWLAKSAELGGARMQCYLGYMYHVGNGLPQDMAKAVKWYTKSAEQGNAEAQYYLGNCYLDGDGVTRDYAKAVEWLTKSAEQGNAEAQCNLGYCYENGLGVHQSWDKAVELYTKSAEQGNAIAQCNLGNCYANGLGVQRDKEKAREWYQKAADQGYENAKKALQGLK